MSNARIQFSLASEDVWLAYDPVLKEGEIVTVLKTNKKVKLVQGKVGGSKYSESTIIWDEDTAETVMNRSEVAAATATAQASAASSSASKAAASQAAAATSQTNAKASETAAKTSETNAKTSESAAGKSATSAASSASTASTQAGKATDSATAAASSAAQAGTFASTASTKATAADKSATAADKSAKDAAVAAETATSKASEAATSATSAAKSATSAANSATEASGLVTKADYGFLKRNTAYAVGDIAYSTQLPAGYYLECVTAGTTGENEPTFNVGGVMLDGSVEWTVQHGASVASVESVKGVADIAKSTAEQVNEALVQALDNLYIKAGDEIYSDANIYIAGVITNSNTEINCHITIPRPISAEHAEVIGGVMRCRQNGNYCIGTATETVNILDVSTPVIAITQYGLRLRLTFNKAISVQNNSTLSMQFRYLQLKFS